MKSEVVSLQPNLPIPNNKSSDCNQGSDKFVEVLVKQTTVSADKQEQVNIASDHGNEKPTHKAPKKDGTGYDLENMSPSEFYSFGQNLIADKNLSPLSPISRSMITAHMMMRSKYELAPRLGYTNTDCYNISSADSKVNMIHILQMMCAEHQQIGNKQFASELESLLDFLKDYAEKI